MFLSRTVWLILLNVNCKGRIFYLYDPFRKDLTFSCYMSKDDKRLVFHSNINVRHKI